MIRLKQVSIGICIICIFILALILYACNQIQPKDPASEYQKVSVISTEKRTIHSNIIQQDFEIYVSLPYKYGLTDTTYPVLFCLDANVKFGMVSNIINNLGALTHELPEIIVVGIAYPIRDIADWAAMRKRDTTPTSIPEYDKEWGDYLNMATGRNDIIVQSGGADKFLKFIHDELIPFIESEYRVSSDDRAIYGTSSGGLFAVYALFQHPQCFQKYFAGSPSINWDESYMYKLEEKYAAVYKDLPVRLFMCVGGLEREVYLNNLDKMSQLLFSRKYPNFELETYIFEGETHGTTGPASICRGLKMLYNN